MPRVPRLASQQVQEGGLNLRRQQTQVTDETFGGGAALEKTRRAASGLGAASSRLMGQAINSAIDIESRERQKANRIANTEVEAKLSNRETELLHDPNRGAYTRKGKDAFGLPEEVFTEYDKTLQELTEGAANEDQKEFIRQRGLVRKAGMNRQLNQHMLREGQKLDEQNTRALVSNEINAAVKNAHDPDRVKSSLLTQEQAIRAHGQDTGKSSEVIKSQVLESKSKTHFGVISQLANSGVDHEEVKDYYAKNRKDLTADDDLRIKRVLDQTTLQGESQKLTDKILAKTPDLSDALSQARNIKDPRKRDEVVKRVKQRMADDRLAKRLDDERNFDIASEAIEDNANMDSIPKEVLANLTPKSKRALEAQAAMKRNGLSPVTDANTFYELEQLAGTPSTRDKFLTMNLKEVKHLLSETDFKRFAKMQVDFKKGSTKGMDGIESKTSIVNGALGAVDMPFGANADPEDKARANQFRREVDRLVVQRQDLTGKKVTNEELREITENLMVELVTDKGIFFDETKKVFEITPEDAPLIETDSIPTAELQKIRNTLRDRNIPVTDENMIAMYLRRLNQITGR